MLNEFDCNNIVRCQKLGKEIEDSNMRMQKLYRDGLQFSSHIFLLQNKVDDQIFPNYSPFDLHGKTKEAEDNFETLLSNAMEQNRLPQFLSNLREQWKKEAQSVLQEYDKIISQINNGLDIQDKEYREKIEKHCIQHEQIRGKIENLLSELSKTGEEEVCTIRTAISRHLQDTSDELWRKSDLFLDETSADKPFDTYVWREPSEMLTSQQLEEVFFVDQSDVINLRRDLLSEVCKLRIELEKERLNYKLERQTLEQDTFYLKQKYNKAVPEAAKMKRTYFQVCDTRKKLIEELNKLNSEIEKESGYNFEKSCRHTQKILKKDNLDRRIKIFQQKQSDACDQLSLILIDEKFIFENVLEFPRDIPSLMPLSSSTDIDIITSDNYWKQFLDLASKTVFLEEVFCTLYKYWEQQQLCCELMSRNQALSAHYKEFHVLLQCYHKTVNGDVK